MKMTNTILAIFLTISIVQAQNSLNMSADSILACNANLASIKLQNPETVVAESVHHTVAENLLQAPEDEMTEKSPAKSNFVFFCYPSMFSNELFVTIDLEEPAEIQLMNEAGAIVFKQKTEGIVENKKFTMPSDLPTGIYFLKIKDKEAASVKLMKRN